MRTPERRLRLTTDDVGDDVSDEALDPALARVAQRLRADVPVRRAWRDAVLREVARTTAPRHRMWPLRGGHTLALRPVAAAAACLACLSLGVAAGRTLARRDTLPAIGVPARTGGASGLVQFVLVAPGAARVSLVGDFNAWDARATPMRASGDGRSWLVALPLAPGRHTYAFVVDGDVVVDPAAPRTASDDFGVPNSVVLVRGPSA